MELRSTSLWPRVVASLLLVASLAILDRGCRLWWDRYSDDAFITLRYAKNWVEGHGPVFNPGEAPVEGYSNPSWVAAMAAAMWMDVHPVLASKLLGVASAAVLILALFWSLAALGAPAWAAALATLLVSSCEVVLAWSVSGLETLAYALAVFAGLVLLVPPKPTRTTAVLASLALCVAALSRPEGIAMWLGGAGFLLLVERRHLVAYLVPGVTLLAHLAWRRWYYGDWVPNTFYVRAPEGWFLLEAGLEELRGFLFGKYYYYFYEVIPLHAVWVALAGFCAFAAVRWGGQGRRVLLMGVAVLACTLYTIGVGGDSLGFFRYYVPIFAPLAYLVGLVFVGSADPPPALRRIRTAVALSVAGITVWSAWVLPKEGRIEDDTTFQDGNVKLGRVLAATRPPTTRIAVAASGAIPYYSNLPTIDMLGLSDRHIAQRPPNDRKLGGYYMVGHSKFDVPYVLSLEPDIIVLTQGYVRFRDARAEQLAANPLGFRMNPLDEQIFDHVYWGDDYELRALNVGDGDRFYVFERRKPGDGPNPTEDRRVP